jgi:hypothetical protein
MQSDPAHDELVEKVARAACDAVNGDEAWDETGSEVHEKVWCTIARAALSIARPAIREECARLCEKCSLHDEDGVGGLCGVVSMTDDLVERVADVISMVFEGAGVTETAKGVIALALEEAAKVVGAMPRTHTKIKEDHDVLGMTGTWTFTLNNGPAECAAAIRAMIKEKTDE